MNAGNWSMNKDLETPNDSAALAFLEHYKGQLPEVRWQSGKEMTRRTLQASRLHVTRSHLSSPWRQIGAWPDFTASSGIVNALSLARAVAGASGGSVDDASAGQEPVDGNGGSPLTSGGRSNSGDSENGPPLIGAGGSDVGSGQGMGRVLRVVLAVRPKSSRRRILNAVQLLDFCNSWVPASGTNSSLAQQRATEVDGSSGNISDGSGGAGGVERGAGSRAFVRASCVSYDFEDVLTSAALMKQSDVLFGMHGEDEGNSDGESVWGGYSN